MIWSYKPPDSGVHLPTTRIQGLAVRRGAELENGGWPGRIFDPSRGAQGDELHDAAALRKAKEMGRSMPSASRTPTTSIRGPSPAVVVGPPVSR